jgi:hypothetical protein
MLAVLAVTCSAPQNPTRKPETRTKLTRTQ